MGKQILYVVNPAEKTLQNINVNVDFKVLIKMTNVIVTLKIMPESPEVDLAKLQEEVKKHILEFAGEGETKFSEEPVAFGLKSVNVIFIMDEALGSPDALEETVKGTEGVQSVEVTDVRRAIG